MNLGLLIGTLLLILIPASALTISYEITPEIVLPNGYADCVITLKAENPITIKSISFYSETVEFEPSYISQIGNLSAGGIYILRVSMKSSVVGRQNALMTVSTSDGSFTQNIELVVDDKFPEISLASPLYRGEVNQAKLLISSPVPLKNLRIEAMFNSSPKTFFAGNIVGSTEFSFRLGEELEHLNFKLSFYNGRSYHEIEKKIRVEYLPSKGLLVNLQPSKDVLFIGEAVNLSLEISNLRSDEIYNIEIDLFANGKFSQTSAKIDKILPNEKKNFSFIFSPRKSENAEIIARIKYSDFFGKEYVKIENLTLTVLESYVLQIINLHKAPNIEKTRISGEVVNYGHRSALNTRISVFCDENRADYYIGEIDAKDYETFDLEILCTVATLSLTWWNDAGDSFSVSEKLELERLEKREQNPMPIYIALLASAVVIVFLIYVVYRTRKK